MAAAACAMVAVAYILGSRRPVRLLDSQSRWGSRHWRATAFFSGIALVLVTTSSPLDALARHAFWLQAAQLMILAMVAAPVLVVGSPAPRLRRLLGVTRPAARRTVWWPMLGFTLFNGALILAYLPAVYRATAESGWPRSAGQLVMVALAFLFWSQVIAQPPEHCALPHLGRVVYLFLSSAQLRILGVVLGFASAPYYNVSLIDQQLGAGMLMVPGVITDLVVLTVCLYLWLGQDDRKSAGRIDTGGRTLPVIGQRTPVHIAGG